MTVDLQNNLSNDTDGRLKTKTSRPYPGILNVKIVPGSTTPETPLSPVKLLMTGLFSKPSQRGKRLPVKKMTLGRDSFSVLGILVRTGLSVE